MESVPLFRCHRGKSMSWYSLHDSSDVPGGRFGLGCSGARETMIRGSNKTNLKASVAPQPAFGHPLLARLVSTHASVESSVPPLRRGGQGGWTAHNKRAQPSR